MFIEPNPTYPPLPAECVSMGHPDKVADQISDTVVDFFIHADKDARVACETLVSRQSVIVRGEVGSFIDITDRRVMDELEENIRRTIQFIGYKIYHGQDQFFDCNRCNIDIKLVQQSKEISSAVNGSIIGAGDQGVVVGHYDCHTRTGMPISMEMARMITNELPFLCDGLNLPDYKVQVSWTNDRRGLIPCILVSTSHLREISVDDLQKLLTDGILKTYDDAGYSKSYPVTPTVVVNPAGAWLQGGPASDTGVTGRKIVVDSYGPSVPVGGGAFSGKDWTKVDRSGAYMARWVAGKISKISGKSINVHVAYIIGDPDPCSISIKELQNNDWSDLELSKTFSEIGIEVNDFTPERIRDRFKMNTSLEYVYTSRYGHFGTQTILHPWDDIR